MNMCFDLIFNLGINNSGKLSKKKYIVVVHCQL